MSEIKPINLIKSADNLQNEAKMIIDKMRNITGSTNINQAKNVGESNEFSSVLIDAIKQVNSQQLQSSDLKNAYSLGDKSVSLAEVVLASQKANIGFKFLLNVRNKAVEAYRDIMNMPV